MTFSTFAFYKRRLNCYLRTIQGLNFATVNRSLLMSSMNDAMRIPSTLCLLLNASRLGGPYRSLETRSRVTAGVEQFIMTIPSCIMSNRKVYFILRTSCFKRWFTLNRCYINRLVTCFSVFQQDPSTKFNLNSPWHLY